MQDRVFYSICFGVLLRSLFRSDVFLFFCFGIFRFNMVDIANPSVFESRVSQKSTFEGITADEPSIKENNQQLNVEIKDGENKTNVLLSVGLDENYKYGDKINFTGKLEKPENFITDQGKVFDYINYLRKDGVLYVMSYPKIEIISRENGN